MVSNRPRRGDANDNENEEVRAEETNAENGERPARNRDYMLTWGSTVQKKQEFADKAAEDEEQLSEEDRARIEAERPGVNPVVSPNVDSEGKPVE